MKKFLVVSAAVLIFIMFAACGKGPTIKTEDGSINIKDGKIEVKGKDGQGDATLTIKDNKVEVKAKDGKSVISVDGDGNGSLPEGYPKDVVPIIDGAKIEVSSKTEENKKVAFWVSYSSSKTPKEIYTFYEDKLKGIEEIQKIESEEMWSVSGIKEGHALYIMIIADDKDGKKVSNVQITIEPK